MTTMKNMRIDILKPKIFDSEKVIAGVTKRNLKNFPKIGFSIKQSGGLSIGEMESHRQAFAEEIGVAPEKLIFMKQVHGEEIVIVDKLSKEPVADGMITNKTDVVLVATIADCCAVLIHNEKENVVAALHAGWRGAKANIVKKGIDVLTNIFCAKPDYLKIFMSPCASAENYEVGEEVAEFFPDNVKKMENGKFLLDLKGAVLSQILDCGVPRENVEVSPIGTIADEDYHSHRRDGNRAGRMGAFIGLK